MEQVALNTIIGIMMAVFPGFLFRKFYYQGEFTKQFAQSNEIDKLLWNLFFSLISIGMTVGSIYLIKTFTPLNIVDSLSYDTFRDLATTIGKNEVPTKVVMSKTYKDILTIISLIYAFSAFFGALLFWLIRSTKADIYFSILRFKNYWYYYIHGGKILYVNSSSKTTAFTFADILCEIAGETRIYKGIISQYTINKEDNNLENIFLTNTHLLVQKKDKNGDMRSVGAKEIPGTAFCIPYKTILNINLLYVYQDAKKWRPRRSFIIILNTVTALSLTLVIASLWFDLSSIGVIGAWRKTCYIFWCFVGLTNFRLLIYSKNRRKYDWISQASLLITSLSWIVYFMGKVPSIVPWVMGLLAICLSATITNGKKSTETQTPE